MWVGGEFSYGFSLFISFTLLIEFNLVMHRFSVCESVLLWFFSIKCWSFIFYNGATWKWGVWFLAVSTPTFSLVASRIQDMFTGKAVESCLFFCFFKSPVLPSPFRKESFFKIMSKNQSPSLITLWKWEKTLGVFVSFKTFFHLVLFWDANIGG